MKRRSVLKVIAAVPILTTVMPALTLAQRITASTAQNSIEEMRKQWRDWLPKNAEVPSPKQKLKLTKSQWESRLSDQEFRVLRQSDTEQSFSSALNSEKHDGIYVCAGCELPLFSSEMKYDSGTGWPSFFTTIPQVFETKDDFSLFGTRTEYHCVRCGGHHGHVFDDGPPPTGKRWCNNGAALKFLRAGNNA